MPIHAGPPPALVMPQPAAAPRMQPSWWIPDAGSGWLDFTPRESGHILVRVTLNGEPVWALLDTGFDTMAISKRFAAAHHLATVPWTRPLSFGGVTPFDLVDGVSMTIGDVHTQAPGTFAAVDFAAIESQLGLQFDVVIGLQLLNHTAWEIDEDRHRIRLAPSGTVPIGDGVAIHQGPASSRLLTSLRIDGTDLPATMIDTGAEEAFILTRRAAERIPIKPVTDIASEGIGGIEIEELGHATDTVIGSQSFGAQDLHILDAESILGSKGVESLIGMGILRRYNLVIDPSAGKMQLSARATAVPPPAKSTTGVQGMYADARLTIVHIMKNSPAEAARLKAGDAICAIDGKPMSQQLFDSHWGRAAPGTRYRLTLCDGRIVRLVTRAFY